MGACLDTPGSRLTGASGDRGDHPPLHHGPRLAHQQPVQSFKRNCWAYWDPMNLAWGQFPWSVDNHHTAEQSQGLDLCQYFTARCLDLSCQQHLLPHHPEQYSAGSTMCIAGSFWRFLHSLWQVLEIQTLYCIYLLH